MLIPTSSKNDFDNLLSFGPILNFTRIYFNKYIIKSVLLKKLGLVLC